MVFFLQSPYDVMVASSTTSHLLSVKRWNNINPVDVIVEVEQASLMSW